MERDPILAELARSAATGDRASLREIYERTAQRLFREVLVPILVSRAACEDALKETFVAVLEHPARLAQGEVFAFLATIARNKALDRRRRLATEGRFAQALASELEQAEAALPDPEDAVQALEARMLAREKVEAVLVRMSARYAQALRLRLLEERTRDQCAAALGTTVGAFDVLFFRACKQFRALYVESHGRRAGGTK
ncbi:MAG: RNA polymerase sigma factor [Deltaproteobacteria bacterium]|nr:RNA polymerase sigma factor [Deltaproteobacteria bacterium]